MMKFTDKKGFSLVELMIVVAIIAILAAIAIPSFLRFALRSKTAEATSNLAGIRTGEEAYRAEHDVYLECTAYPGAVPPAGGTMWVPTAAGNFTPMGFAADGVVRYQYDVEINEDDAVPFFTAKATGDLDDDDLNAVWLVSNNPGGSGAENRQNAAGDRAPAVYPKAILVATGPAAAYDDF